MYKKGEEAIDRILELVKKCPANLQEKCFEVLLSGYVQTEVGALKPAMPAPASPASPPPPPSTAETAIPQAALPRFRTMAKRLEVSLDKLEALFDFNIDPFALHAVTVPGANNAVKSRNVALLAAARSHLATGAWTADWQEVRSLCVDHSCYDQANYKANLKKGDGTVFKTVEAGSPIELSANGIKEAEKLLKTLAAGGSSE